MVTLPAAAVNQTEDRRSEKASRGVTCLDCHATAIPMGRRPGGRHPPAGAPPSHETPPLRGVNIQRLFGSQRALKSVTSPTSSSARPISMATQ
jgi:hypothetical protein